MWKTIIIFSVLTTVAYAVQYANYFQVNIRACKAIDPGTVVAVINHSGVLAENGQCKEDRIVYTISGRIFSNTPTVTIRHFLSLMLVDMKAHYISELNKLTSNPTAGGEPQSKAKINAMWKQIENTIPNCKLILPALDCLYNKDVDFEDLLSAYYAICVVPRKWFQRYWEVFPSVAGYRDNPYSKLVLFLWEKFGLDTDQQASLSFFTDSESQMTRWNVFLQDLNGKVLSAGCRADDKRPPNTLWMEPEWLTLSVLMQNEPGTSSDDTGMKMLLQSAVQVNDIYKSISAKETTLWDLYHSTVRQDVDHRTLLAWYDVVLQKMDQVIDSFLYRHVAMIYANMISADAMTDDAVLGKLNRLMKSCDWQSIVKHFVGLLTRLKCSYAVSFSRTTVMNAIADESWHADYSLARKAIRANPEASVLTSGILKMFPPGVATDSFALLIVSRGFKYDYEYTDKWVWRNCNQAFDYIRELSDLTTKRFGLDLDLTALQKFKRIRTV